MDIALIASDKRKELMAQFCIAYGSILADHTLCGTAITAKYVSRITGLKIEELLSGGLGGIQQISSRIMYDEIDMVILLRDADNDREYATSEYKLIKLCDRKNIPVATNIATAELLIMALMRGDFDWRDNINPKRNRAQ